MGQMVYTAGEQLGMRRCRGNTETEEQQEYSGRNTSPEVVNRDASSGRSVGRVGKWHPQPEVEAMAQSDLGRAGGGERAREGAEESEISGGAGDLLRE